MGAAALASIAGAAFAQDKPPALTEKYQCLGCHAVEKKVVGPAFKEVAKRYKGDGAAMDTLSAKLKNGGKGAWGAVPMPANRDMSDDDAKVLVRWVLGTGG